MLASWREGRQVLEGVTLAVGVFALVAFFNPAARLAHYHCACWLGLKAINASAVFVCVVASLADFEDALRVAFYRYVIRAQELA